MSDIEFDESEHLYSDFNDKSLRLIMDLCGPDVKDKLLIPRVVVPIALG